MTLPKGATIFMSYVFDNSTNNPVNPSFPPQRVKYGVNSSDEMAELWLQVQNDGTETDSFQVTADESGASGITFKYLSGATNVSTQMRGSGFTISRTTAMSIA